LGKILTMTYHGLLKATDAGQNDIDIIYRDIFKKGYRLFSVCIYVIVARFYIIGFFDIILASYSTHRGFTELDSLTKQ
jgi:hypothetical protein